jgi:uncharacterized repeat protein (TIGR03847 family)
MAIEDLGPAERFTAGAVGSPGARTFYLQVTADTNVHSFVVEKAQVATLAAQGLRLLSATSVDPDPTAVRNMISTGLELLDPEPSRFRVGTISLALDTSQLLRVILESADSEEGVSFVVAPEQFHAMAVLGLEAVASGRPLCPRCGLPEDPEEHRCPSVNGHFVT